MSRKFNLFILVAVVALALVAAVVVSGSTATRAQTSNLRAHIQSLLDKGQAFTLILGLTAFQVNGSTAKVSALGDDFVCVAGETQKIMDMSRTYQEFCTPFATIAITIP